jgi:iron complex outermembrane receptor protein
MDVYHYGNDLSKIGAIFDSRYQNLSAVTTSGLDLSSLYRAAVVSGTLELGVDGTYILQFDNRVSPKSPATSILNTPYNPIDLRLRGRVSYTRGPISLNGFLNYVNSYTDNRVSPTVSAASWTTTDVSAVYRFINGAEPLRNAIVTLAVVNVANRNPPFLTNQSVYPVDYDGANANPLGRFYSLQISKRL